MNADFSYHIESRMDRTITYSNGDLKGRTKLFALNVIKLVETLPTSQTTAVIGKQLLRAATAVGANYRAACRARSRADFISKITVVEEEADETAYWLELLHELQLITNHQFESLEKEAHELTAIFVSSSKTAKANARPK
jgi:four helix bundle protein